MGVENAVKTLYVRRINSLASDAIFKIELLPDDVVNLLLGIVTTKACSPLTDLVSRVEQMPALGGDRLPQSPFSTGL